MREWFQIIFGLAILAAIALLSLGMVCAGIKPKTVYTWVANGKLSKPDVISTRYSRFPLSRVKQDYFRQFGRELILKD